MILTVNLTVNLTVKAPLAKRSAIWDNDLKAPLTIEWE